MERQFIEGFEGPHGKSEVWEVAITTATGTEEVHYEVACWDEVHLVQTMGEASILACELSGDSRFLTPGQGTAR